MTEDERTVTGAVTRMGVTAIEGLKTQPGLLVISLLNALLFLLLYFGVTATNARRDEHLMKVIETCFTRGHT